MAQESKTEASSPKRIVVRTPNWIGDHVMARPFYHALRKAYPHSQITFLCPESLKNFDDSKFAHQKLTLTSAERKISKAFLKRASEIKTVKFDLAFCLPASFSAAFFLFLAGARNRLGFSNDGGVLFHSFSIPWKGIEDRRHKSNQYLQLLETSLGHPIANDWQTPQSSRAREKLIVIAPGASISLREYPYFPELLRLLSVNYPTHRIVVTGSNQESKFKSQIARLKLANIEDRIGLTTLEEVIELCGKAEAVLSNDSGVAHLSATLASAPTVILFGPGDPFYISPLGANSHPIRIDIPCSPCEKSYCRAPYGYQACLRGIAPEIILQRIKALTSTHFGH